VLGWILDHRIDVMADFRSIYHIGWREAMRLPAEEFLGLATRLPFYPGVIANRAEQAEKRERRNVRDPSARFVSERDSSISDLIEFG
jgi:hypothetical protein